MDNIKDTVTNILKTIVDPYLGSNLVDAGVVKNLTLDHRKITIDLELGFPTKTYGPVLKKRVLEEVKDLDDYDLEVNVTSTILTRAVQKGIKPLPEVRNVVAVASGKGGVGKSTVAANIACSFSQKGYKVGLLDLDIYGPSLPIILGINESPQLTQDKKLIPLDWNGLKVLSFGFISGNDSPAIWRGPLVARMTEQFFRDVLWGDLDYLILDLPPGTGDVQLTLTQKIQISGAIIVTTPQDIALSDVRKGADMFRKVNTPVLGVIENMSGLILKGIVYDSEKNPLKSGFVEVEEKYNSQIDENGTFTLTIDLFKKGGGERESQRLGVPLLGKIPLSQTIMDSTDAGNPIAFGSPDNPYSKIFSNIVLQIAKDLGH